ncbi:hypothetical protein V8F06_009038 [Rhypophila decipiens]
MDFERTSMEWTDHDFSSFGYEHKGESVVLTKALEEEGVRFELRSLVKKDEWKGWLQKTSFLKGDANMKRSNPGLCIVLVGRGDLTFNTIWDGMQAPVQYLPFDQAIFIQLVRLFRIHPRITRTIGRESCYFSVQHQNDADEEGSMISCTARTSSQLPDDLAFSSAFIPHLNLNLAVVYGCNQKQKREAIKRIQACDLAEAHHPLLLAGMLFEMERVRLGDAVDKLLDNFALRGSSSDRDLDLDMDKARMTEFLRSCYESRELVNHIKAVQLELGKLITAVSATISLPNSALLPTYPHQPEKSSDRDKDNPDPDPHPDLNFDSSSSTVGNPNPNPYLPASAAHKILTRLHDISLELTTKSHDCNLVNSNMSLTMTTAMSHFARLDNQTNLKLSRVNTELARTNTGLSHDMKRDSSQMRSIALLTMVFLPMTTVASIFSTGFFTWDADTAQGEEVVSGWIWVLVVVSVGLTLAVVGIWWWATRRERKRAFAGREIHGGLKRAIRAKKMAGRLGRVKAGRVGRVMGRIARDLRLNGNKNREDERTGEDNSVIGTEMRHDMSIDLERGLDDRISGDGS